MNTTSEAIFQAVDILVEKAISKLQYDRTIQAEIYSIVNLDTGEYKIKYSGNIVSAFSTTEQYNVGDNVYVTIPEGNTSNKKMIVGLVNSSSLSYGQMIALTNSISEVSPGFDIMYGYDASAERGIVAGAPATSELSYSIIYEGAEDDYHGLFQQYTKNNDLIRIKGSFLTRFHCEHTQGNYGLKIEFFTKSGDVVDYKLDLSSFIGDPYSLSVYSPQSVIIKTQKNYLTGVKSIQLFEENFVYDRYVESGVITDKQNTTVPNIFVKDISIQFVEQKDLTENTYYLDISTPRGNSLTSSITSIDLVGRLVYQGENIMSESSCECFWYERDLSVTLGNENYEKNAGVGWKPVTTSGFNAITVTAQDVEYQKQYKLVVVYNNNVVMSDEVTVYNLQSSYDFDLQQVTIGEDIIIQITNNISDEVLIGDWYALYPDGSYVAVGLKQNSITVTNLLLYSSVIFYCGVYNTQRTDIIGILNHTVTNSESEDDITISYDGEDTFRYDANGDVSVEDAEKERTLQVVLTWKDGVGTSYKVSWIGPDGKSITGTRYTPTQSMIENLWVDNSNILHYTIKQKYKVNYNNNTITVKIITVDEQEYIFQKEILFLKDGDQGTNGTTYVTAIRPFNQSTGLKLSGLNPLIYRNNAWQNTLPLRCYIYKDGELINENDNYTLTFNWTGVNVELTDGTSTDKKIVSGQTNIISNSAAPYVKVQATINDQMNGRTYDIYSSYPIDIAVDFTDNEIQNLDINSIPSYIKYTASGVNPSFYSNNIQFLYNDSDLSNNITSLKTDILQIQQDDGLYYLKPASSFIFEDNTIAMLKCKYQSSKYLLHPIVLYLDTYGNESINGWDGTSLQINEEDGYVYAPQIGAGSKDSANRFTGVIMGKDSVNDKIGLYGYQAGVNTFGLMENGIAYFGAKSGGGQIVIDGTTAKIYGGGNYPAGSGQSQVGGDAANGMTITLADLRSVGTTDAIKIGGGVFKVQYNGALTATSANITGTITANNGYIGGKNGWIIAEYRIYSSKSGATHIELNCNPEETYAIWCGSSSSATAASSKFAVTKTGLLYAKEGNIGGWNMKSTYLQAANGTVGMASSGNAAFWAGSGLSQDSSSIPSSSSDAKFLVTRSGKLYCSSAEISGKITANSGTIGGWTISSTRLQSTDGSVYLSSSGGLKVGDNFRVTSGGTLTANNANINGTIDAEAGYIGGWRITSNRISAGGTTLYDDGRIRCDSLTAYDANISGTIDADDLTCYNGTIGGWSISRNGLSSGQTTLDSDGNLYAKNFVTPSGFTFGDSGNIVGIRGSESYLSVTDWSIGLSCSGDITIGLGANEVIIDRPASFTSSTSGIQADDIDGLDSFVTAIVESMLPASGS